MPESANKTKSDYNSEFADKNVMSRVKFTDEEISAVKQFAKDNESTALITYQNAIEWYMRLDKEEHRHLYSSPQSGKTRPIWIKNAQYKKMKKFADKVDHLPARVVYTATVKYLINVGYLA
jgi:hypothetical protein